MLSLVLIRTIARGSKTENQEKPHQINPDCCRMEIKHRWQQRQELLCQKILSVDTLRLIQDFPVPFTFYLLWHFFPLNGLI